MRALQAVGAVAAVEVARVDVNLATGNYSLVLPTAAPRLLTYSNPMVTPLNFQPQTASAGKYKIEASATGYRDAAQQRDHRVRSAPMLGGPNFTLARCAP